MKIIVKNLGENPVTLLRRAGYVFQRKEGEETSFVRALGSGGFPRFHAYVKMGGPDLLVNVHLDQKRETYGESTRHHGEYGNEGPLKEESSRLAPLIGGEIAGI
jgi:hypothetical protein